MASPHFQELDYQQTELGELTLRVRSSLAEPGVRIYEVKLNGEFLMSSQVHASERALATLALDALGERGREVLVGGLGLGHTAAAVLGYPSVQRLHVVEYLQPVIEWHRRRLVPASATLMDDPRCTLVHADFFETVAADGGDGGNEAERYDAILLDIDHSPGSLLSPRHARFYTEAGLSKLMNHLRPGGVFAIWSADHPGEAFMSLLRAHFASVRAEGVAFFVPHLNQAETDWVVLAERG